MHIFVLKLCWNKGSNVVENKLEPHKEREREGKRISQVSAPEGQVCPEVLLSPKEHEMVPSVALESAELLGDRKAKCTLHP